MKNELNAIDFQIIQLLVMDAIDRSSSNEDKKIYADLLAKILKIRDGK